jgi:AraC-like DNA-binding protein
MIATAEQGTWRDVAPGWRQAFGSFADRGVSVEVHDFTLHEPLDWGRSFHPDSVEICLNLAGDAELGEGRDRQELTGRGSGVYALADEALTARRSRGEHRFVTIELSFDFLSRHLAGLEGNVREAIRDNVFGGRRKSAVVGASGANEARNSLASALWKPPVAPAALPLWYESKVIEATTLCLFAPVEGEMFCSRQKRLAHDRVERACAILREKMEAPPSLEELGRTVGVSQFYLSRIFSEEMQMSIPQYLRRVRMERAAELLRGGRHNVTEAAFEVGYSSLGHFSKSFCEVIGCCPTLYPNARTLAAHRPRC